MSDGGGWGRDEDTTGGPGDPNGGWGDQGSSSPPPGGGWGDQGTGSPPAGGGWGDPGSQGGQGAPPGGAWGGQPGQAGGGWSDQGGFSSPEQGGQWGGQPGNIPPPPQGGGTNTKAVAAISCGIASLIFMILFFPLGILLAIAGIVLGILGSKDAKRTGAGGRGMAITGIVTGTLSLLLMVLGAIGLAFVFSQFDSNPFTDPEGFIQELEQEGFEFDEDGNVVDAPDDF